jgi:hypothetical protein
MDINISGQSVASTFREEVSHMGKIICKTGEGMTGARDTDCYTETHSTLMLKTRNFIYSPLPFSIGILLSQIIA